MVQKMSKEILFLEPVFTHNIWGGTKLREEYNYDIEGDDIGECWGVAAHDTAKSKTAAAPEKPLPNYGRTAASYSEMQQGSVFPC